MNRTRGFGWLWFLVGLGSSLQIFSSLSMTELAVLICGSIWMVSELQYMRRDGTSGFFWLSFLLVVGCVVSCVANHSSFPAVLRGMAMTTIMWLAVPFMHRMLRRDPLGFKWFVVGSCLSVILCTFVFQRAVEVSINAKGLTGSDAVEGIMSGPIFWISRLSKTLTAPAAGWYVRVPIAYSVCAPLFIAGFAMLTSASGRSAALGSLASAGLCILGGKKSKSMKRICKNFGVLCVLAAMFVFLAKAAYSFAAKSGLLNEKATAKYELQTRSGSGIISLLMSGRAASFVGLFACKDKPLVGWGPWARDTRGYAVDFLMRYGSQEDVEDYVKRKYEAALNGWEEEIGMIPCHSHVTQFWLWYGLPGLIYWMFAMFVFVRHLRKDCYVVPHWFFWLTCSVPGFCWNIFFSPLANRTDFPLIILACLMARAYRLRKAPMAPDVFMEIRKYER